MSKQNPKRPMKIGTIKVNSHTVASETGFPSCPTAGSFISLLDKGSQPHLTNSVNCWLLNHVTYLVTYRRRVMQESSSPSNEGANPDLRNFYLHDLSAFHSYHS